MFRRALAVIVALSCIAIGASCPAAFAQSGTPEGEPGREDEYVEPLSEPLAVIPPGREALLAEMLGRGETLPGDCAFKSGQVDRDSVTATYGCTTGPLVLELHHPSQAPSDATLTEQFAIAVKSGQPPAGLIDELATRIRAREKTFAWTWLGPTTSPRLRLITLAVAACLGAAVTLFVLRRRRAARAS